MLNPVVAEQGTKLMIAKFTSVIGDYLFEFSARERLSLSQERLEQKECVGLTLHGEDKSILGEAIDNL